MIKKLSIIFLLLLISFIGFAQQSQFKENVGNGYTRFFYDENYYLVDKHCEFKSIERVAQYDSTQLKFNGEFKDFNRFGKLILHGYYKNGVKNGKFTAYHPNGEIKWESTFVDNNEVGNWNYYYPDGKPMLTLLLDSNDFKIIDYWDTFGQHKVANGEGVYEMVLPIKGFTDHGYTEYHLKGIIADAKPEGKWTTSFVDDRKKENYIPVFQEVFSEGKRTSLSVYYDLREYYIGHEDFTLVPSNYFGRAEYFLAQDCSFDEFSGFHSFLRRKFNHILQQSKFETPDTTFQYKIKYTVNKNGTPTKINIIEHPENLHKSINRLISNEFRAIPYFIPSILDDNPINDNLTLTAHFAIVNGICTMQYSKLEREKGH